MLNRDMFQIWFPVLLVTVRSKLSQYFGAQRRASLSATSSFCGSMRRRRMMVRREDLKVDFGQFLTHWMRATATVGTTTRRGNISRSVRSAPAQIGEDVFRRLTEDGRRTGPFSNAAFEFIATGVQYNLREWRGDHEALQKRIHQVWNDPSFANHVGGG